VFFISLIEERRAIPIFWQSLPKRGSSNLGEQKALIRPLLRLFKGYRQRQVMEQKLTLRLESL
jgi:hypothetical protein